MTEFRNVLKIDLDSLSGFQKSLHLPEHILGNTSNMSGDIKTDQEQEDEEKIDSRFSGIFSKTSWSTDAKSSHVSK